MGLYPLVMTNIAMENRWPIEIDGLPFLITWWMFHGKLLNNRMAYIYMYNICVVCAVLSIDLIKTAPDGNLECQFEI